MTDFDQTGFALIPSVLSPAECTDSAQQISALPLQGAGSRNLLEEEFCTELGRKLLNHAQLCTYLGRNSTCRLVPVQCTYFAKSSQANWLVPVHQDLSIPVAGRFAHADWSGWSVKQGQTFVQPPLEVLQSMVAVRVHLDDCGAADGPLRAVAGSHRLGKLTPEAAAGHRASDASVLASAGDVLVMRPLLLHRSSKATGSSQRRVLHFVYGPAQLPDGAAWQHATCAGDA
jgi:hypothetical protein